MGTFKDVLGLFGKRIREEVTSPPSIIKLTITSRTYNGKNTSRIVFTKNNWDVMRREETLDKILNNLYIRSGASRETLYDFQFTPGYLYDCSGPTEYIMVRADLPSDTELLLFNE